MLSKMVIFPDIVWNSMTFFINFANVKISLTLCKIPWQFPDLEKFYFSLTFPWRLWTLQYWWMEENENIFCCVSSLQSTAFMVNFPEILSVKLGIFQSILKSNASQINKHLKLDWRLFRYFGNASQINHWLKCFATGDISNGFFLHKNNGSSEATLVSSGATADSIVDCYTVKTGEC